MGICYNIGCITCKRFLDLGKGSYRTPADILDKGIPDHISMWQQIGALKIATFCQAHIGHRLVFFDDLSGAYEYASEKWEEDRTGQDVPVDENDFFKGERERDVVRAARVRGWLVSETPEKVLCPNCQAD